MNLVLYGALFWAAWSRPRPQRIGKSRSWQAISKTTFSPKTVLWSVSAPWLSGLGHVPLGFSTYAPNAMEVARRVLKGMLNVGYQRRDVGSLLREVCSSVATKVEKGDDKDLQSSVPEPWSDLLQSKRAKQVASGKDDAGQEQKAVLLGKYFPLLHFWATRFPLEQCWNMFWSIPLHGACMDSLCSMPDSGPKCLDQTEGFWL